jgi:low affinity Fe/Cu permease
VNILKYISVVVLLCLMVFLIQGCTENEEHALTAHLLSEGYSCKSDNVIKVHQSIVESAKICKKDGDIIVVGKGLCDGECQIWSSNNDTQ